MKLGLMVGYWMTGPQNPAPLAIEAENLGFDSVWTAEAYGSDAITPLTWIAAQTSKIKLGTGIVQISARTPACVAMTAMTLDHLSGGRLMLGFGVSGPQVVEGWYGQPFPKPLGRSREFISLFREMMKREGPLTFEGEHYQLPLKGGSGLGKPLKLINKPLRSHIPVLLGAEGPKNIQMATELCDGWLPLYYSPFHKDVYEESLTNASDDFMVIPPVQVNVNDDLEQALLPVKYMLAFYIGGMGARKKNFHANLVTRFGYGAEVEKIQDLFAEGKRDEAAQVVPDDFADSISLVGSKERIRDRLGAWKESRVTTLLVGATDVNSLRTVAEILL
ncbi:MAG: LLM class F420-dependent oxidoreductase [Candidatus Binatia bacterium]|nr:LLM class F420-dependent oxidoreductase [Candidatus Binatia bacterium]